MVLFWLVFIIIEVILKGNKIIMFKIYMFLQKRKFIFVKTILVLNFLILSVILIIVMSSQWMKIFYYMTIYPLSFIPNNFLKIKHSLFNKIIQFFMLCVIISSLAFLSASNQRYATRIEETCIAYINKKYINC